jgi:hypothetical protein
VNTIIYVVSSTDVLVMSSDSQTGGNASNAFAGELLKQSGTLSGNPLSGAYFGYNSSLTREVPCTVFDLTADGLAAAGQRGDATGRCVLKTADAS